MKTIYFILVFFLLSTFLAATIINVPADQPTIQEGINVAVDGDTVLVQPGDYQEMINFNGKNITVASLFLTTQDTTYISQTIIDGNQNGSVVIFNSGEDSTAVLTGFTITNGYSLNGGGIYCHNSNPTIENCTFDTNSAYHGGGIYCNNSSPSLENITITGNSASLSGGGIFCSYGSSPSLNNVTIENNSASLNGGGINCIYDSSPSLINVIITDNSAENYGGGIGCIDASPSLVNVTITGNTSIAGGGIFCWNNSNSNLVNCILWNDSPDEIHVLSSSVTATYSDIQGGWTGSGNIDEDPLFVGTGEHPHSLLEDSPCIDAGIPDTTGLNLPPWDIIGNLRIWDGDGNGSAIIDMGAYEYGAPPYVDVDDNVIVQTPEVFLHQNYPNPFNPTTTINYSLKDNSKVSLNIYNIKGQKVNTLINELLPAGEHSVAWNGKDTNGNQVSSGIYFYKLKAGDLQKVRKMLLLK